MRYKMTSLSAIFLINLITFTVVYAARENEARKQVGSPNKIQSYMSNGESRKSNWDQECAATTCHRRLLLDQFRQNNVSWRQKTGEEKKNTKCPKCGIKKQVVAEKCDGHNCKSRKSMAALPKEEEGCTADNCHRRALGKFQFENETFFLRSKSHKECPKCSLKKVEDASASSKGKKTAIMQKTSVNPKNRKGLKNLNGRRTDDIPIMLPAYPIHEKRLDSVNVDRPQTVIIEENTIIRPRIRKRPKKGFVHHLTSAFNDFWGDDDDEDDADD